MKLLITSKAIVSLEDVRRVEKHIYETSHTSYGERYTIRHHEIIISYNDKTCESIDCGNNAAGEKALAEYFQTIYNTLSEG